MKADFHLHSSFSGDSDTPPESIVRAALRQDLFALCFTDHLDADYPYTDVSFELDADAYLSEIQRLQTACADRIDIRTGVELGLQPHLGDEYRSFTARYPFDFIIGSTHLVDRMDPYYPEFWEKYNPNQGIRRFLEATLENIQAFDDFDVYGHLDYIIRYVPAGEKRFPYSAFADPLDEILKLLIEKGKGIEVNTGGYKAGLTTPNPCPEILKRYRDLGGEILTMGSDAHTPEYVGFSFDLAQELLRECGFRYFTVFRERKAEFIPL